MPTRVDQPSLAHAWWDRDQGADEEKAARRAFTHGAVRGAIQRSDARLAEIYDELYDRTIQFGAHPNEKSATGSLKLDFKAEETQLLQVYLQGDSPALDHWIHTANQVGICVLKIFERVHAQRFTDLGRPDADTKALWQALFPGTPFPACGAPEPQDSPPDKRLGPGVHPQDDRDLNEKRRPRR